MIHGNMAQRTRNFGNIPLWTECFRGMEVYGRGMESCLAGGKKLLRKWWLGQHQAMDKYRGMEEWVMKSGVVMLVFFVLHFLFPVL